MPFEYNVLLFVTSLCIAVDFIFQLRKYEVLREFARDVDSPVRKRWAWLLVMYARLILILSGSSTLYFLRGLIRTW
jgi:hypothetical protein